MNVPKNTYANNQRRAKSGISYFAVFIISIVVLLFGFSSGFLVSENNFLSLPSQTSEQNSDLSEDLSYESVEEVYDTLRENFDGELNEQELIEGLKKGLADASGDNYTNYFTAEESETFFSDLNGAFEGIGAELSEENEQIVVVSPLAGFPAEKAGLRAGDVIFEIDGEDAVGLSVEEAVLKIRGESGTEVVLTIVRDGEKIEIPITRGQIVVPSVSSEVKDDSIGYIKVTRFAEDTGELARQAARKFKEDGITKIILDMRNNSGGYVDAAVEVASIWQNDEVVFEQRSQKDSRVQNAKRKPILDANTETVVLINEGSASASEIVAGALKDNGYATLVGAESFGKGSVQSLANLSNGATLKVTIARWYTPSGINIDEEGISPDITVEMSDEDYEKERDPQLNRAIKELNKSE